MTKSLFRWINKIVDGGLTLLAPQFCQVCGQVVEHRTEGVACAQCWEAYFQTQETYSLACQHCGRWRLNTTNEGFAVQVLSCDQCTELSCHVIRSCGPYQDALRVNVLALKRHPLVSERLRQLIIKSWDGFPELHDSEIVLPVPLAANREQERGHNQAALLAEIIRWYAQIPLDTQSLVRIIETERHRAGMDHQARSRSVHRAFRVVRPRLISGRTVLLMDDVQTSGATLEACTKVLMEAGAQSVCAFTAARTLRHH